MSNEKEWNNAPYKKTDESHEHTVKQKKPDSKGFILKSLLNKAQNPDKINMW